MEISKISSQASKVVGEVPAGLQPAVLVVDPTILLQNYIENDVYGINSALAAYDATPSEQLDVYQHLEQENAEKERRKLLQAEQQTTTIAQKLMPTQSSFNDEDIYDITGLLFEWNPNPEQQWKLFRYIQQERAETGSQINSTATGTKQAEISQNKRRADADLEDSNAKKFKALCDDSYNSDVLSQHLELPPTQESEVNNLKLKFFQDEWQNSEHILHFYKHMYEFAVKEPDVNVRGETSNINRLLKDNPAAQEKFIELFRPAGNSRPLDIAAANTFLWNFMRIKNPAKRRNPLKPCRCKECKGEPAKSEEWAKLGLMAIPYWAPFITTSAAINKRLMRKAPAYIEAHQ